MNLKQIKEKIKKYDVAIIIILIAIISCGDVFYNRVCTGDEYLLLNHTLKIYNRKSDL